MPPPIDSSRDLLFGLLALQNGLINQVQLVAAFQAWTLIKARALADHLIALGHLNDAQRSVIEAMADLHVAKHGDVDRSLAAIPAGRSTRESLAQLGDPDIEGTLAHVRSRSTQQDGEDDADRTATYSVGTATSDGQRFRVLRPHARGGLGAVFVAVDTELHREVALKQILDSHADDPTSRQRFLLEAEVTGGLEHPGVVPVYGLGSYGDGRPYYAMRFIRGDSLKEAIDRFHTDETLKKDPGRRSLELRKLLRRFLDVCNAIDYAHSRGVLHRDIKPGNIIVGRHGETLVVDWGLAKARGRSDAIESSGERPLVPSSASGSAETLPGSALGTPAYMSPEQARGDLELMGPRSDVYSLGATLYYLLTGRPPVAADGDVGAVLRAVQAGDFRTPRQLDPAIDRALEAVCLKAMALKPENRYTTPKALADDVERWMADEPVTAWHEPWTRRLVRWLTRHRTGVAAGAAALLAGMVGLAVVAAVQAQGRAALAAKNRDLTAANAEVRRANASLQAANLKVEQRYDLAVDAIKTFHTGVTEDFLLKQDQFQALRNHLLRSAGDFYQKLSALLKDDTELSSRRALLAANHEVAILTANIGRKEDALAMHRQVLAGREALARAPGAGLAATLDVAESLLTLGQGLEEIGKTDEAQAAYERARAAFASAGGGPPDSPTARSGLAASEFRLGLLHLRTGKVAEALAALHRARDHQNALATADPRNSVIQREQAVTHDGIGQLLEQQGQPDGALVEYRAARAIYQRLADGNRKDLAFRSSLARSHDTIGGLLWATGKLAEALAELRAALAIRQKLAEDAPSSPLLRSGLAATHGNIGLIFANLGRPAEALAEYRTALAIHQQLAEDEPAVTHYRRTLAWNHHVIANLLARAGRPTEAMERYRAAIALLETLVEHDPAITDYRDALAMCTNDAASALLALERAGEARALCRRAMALLEPLVRSEPQNNGYRANLAESLLRSGQVRRAEGDMAGAAADWLRAASIFKDLPSMKTAMRIIEAGCHAGLSAIAGVPGSGVSDHEAQAEAEQAMAALGRAVADGYRDPDALRNEAALDPLRARDDFRLLMMDLAMPAEPFSEDTDADR